MPGQDKGLFDCCFGLSYGDPTNQRGQPYQGTQMVMQPNDKRRLFDKNSREVDIAEIVLHDQDNKGFFRGDKGKVYYQDLNKGMLIQ